MNRNVIKLAIIFVLMVGLGIGDGMTRVSSAASGEVITLNPSIKYQTIVGWEASAQIGQNTSSFPLYKDEIIDRGVNELGITRLRLHSHQFNHAVESSNDNNDPFSINWSGFDFSKLDYDIDEVVIPIRQAMAANGERLYINLITVEVGADNNGFHKNPDEFAEFILAHFIHMEQKYGFVPDAVEVSLEPGVFKTFDQNPFKLGTALVAAGDRLEVNGYTPDFIGPSNTNMQRAISYFDSLIQVAGVKKYLTEFSYHRYGTQSTALVQQIANRAAQHGIGTSMLERIGANYTDLHEDLKVGNNVAWQQFTLAYPGATAGKGGAYYRYDTDDHDLVMGSRTRYLRQYFKFIRPGAVRIEADTTNNTFNPVAFINKNGRYVVVVKAGSGGSFSIKGLPAGTYGVNYTTSSQDNVDQPDVTISSGGTLDTSIPDTGVITIYARNAGSTPTPTATPRPTSTPRPTATATPRPTATSTPRPTATSTPRPTATATPQPTGTPRPTSTPRPTATPTATPTRTATPVPTSTPLPGASTSSLVIQDGQTHPAETISMDIVLDAAPSGIAGYGIELRVDNPALAKITGARIGSSFTSFTQPTYDLAQDGSSVRITALDTGNVGAGASNITLATLRVQGLGEGATSIKFSDTRLDDDSGSPMLPQTASGNIQVLNVAPAVSAGADAVVNEGDTFTRTVSFSDPGGTSWSGSVDYGEGAGPEPLAISGSSFSLSHVYNRKGVYVVTVTISDDSSDLGSDSFEVEVVHVYPTMPGMNAPAKDLDADGLAEDINGNDRLDFDDIVRFFKHMNSPEIQDHVQDFDFNGNGTIDMADIVDLFMMLVSNFGGNIQITP